MKNISVVFFRASTCIEVKNPGFISDKPEWVQSPAFFIRS